MTVTVTRRRWIARTALWSGLAPLALTLLATVPFLGACRDDVFAEARSRVLVLAAPSRGGRRGLGRSDDTVGRSR